MSEKGTSLSTKVLFIVYRTEWWGCLDSLCRQECLKEDTNVYVMSVPRYDWDLRTKQLDAAKKHFEPEQLAAILPQGAKMVDYREFPIEQGFDRIYIHNPYDNTYPVDSVERKFFSSNLKPYAKKLIYVPHLLYIGGIPEQYAHTPVYDNVDAIYLADGRAKYSLAPQYDRKVEIVPSGISEYLDKLGSQLQNRQGTEQRPDTRKKLLFCLSYNNLYYGTEKLVRKIREVFDVLKNYRDIQVIFRPDEDILTRYIWENGPGRREYEALVAYFRKERIGIYDESPDLYRAAAEADGILSVGHPMDYLFSIQGKYVLRLDKDLRPIPSDSIRCVPSLWAVTAVEDEDGVELWFVPEQTRLICRMALRGGAVTETGKVQDQKKAPKQRISTVQAEIVAEVPETASGWLYYINITKSGNSLYLTPFDSEGIWKFDLDTRCFSEQYLPNTSSANMTLTIPYGGYLYLIPRNYPGIVKYNMETEEVQILDGWIEELESHVSPECMKEPYFIWAVKQEGNMLYMASSKCDVWMEFDMDSDTWQMKSMNLPGKRFCDMVKKGEWVWLLPYCGDEVLLWNCKTCESQLIYTAPTQESRKVPYQFLIDLGESIVAVPTQKDDLLLIPAAPQTIIQKMENGKVIEVTDNAPCKEKEYLSEYLKQRKIRYQYVKKLENGRILAYEYLDGAFLILNESLQVLQKIHCRLTIDAVRQQQDLTWKQVNCQDKFNGFLNEDYTLPAMLEYFIRHGQDENEEIRQYYDERIAR